MKKRKLLLALGIVTMLTLPTIQVHATDVDIDTEERNTNVEVEEENPDVEVEEKDPDVEVADTETETRLGRNNITWTDPSNGIRYSYNTISLRGSAVGYNGGPRHQLTVPPTIRRNTQTITIDTIGQDAFRDAQIGSFELPNTLTTIGPRAFMSNRALQSIVIPNSVRTIGDHAFLNCSLLSTVNLGGVTSIGQGSFLDCNIANLTISHGVTHIGHSAFENNRLTSLIIPSQLRVIEQYFCQ